MALSATGTSEYNVYVVDADGEPLTLTNTINRDEFGPTFSPEGTKLAYFANDFDDELSYRRDCASGVS